MNLARHAQIERPTHLLRHPEIARRKAWREGPGFEGWLASDSDRLEQGLISWHWSHLQVGEPLSTHSIAHRLVRFAATFSVLLAFPVKEVSAWISERSASERLRRSNLDDATEELRTVADRALDEGVKAPTNRALSTARRLVPQILAKYRGRLEVYPEAEGSIAIYAQAGPGEALLVLCEGSGSAACFVTHAGRNRRARYQSADDLPDPFMLRALETLDDL